MKVWLQGDEERIAEISERLETGGTAVCVGVPSAEDDVDLFADLNFDEKTNDDRLIRHYLSLNGLVLLSSAKKSLAESLSGYDCNDSMLCGLNALPSFLNRPALELSSLSAEKRVAAESVLEGLGLKVHWVEDRVGMLGPRVVFMIINEACYTVQEGTASYADIDQAMKLGTNYPMGPFEWANRVGVSHVYESLEALYLDTHDERYRISPLLKKQHLSGQPFQISS